MLKSIRRPRNVRNEYECSGFVGAKRRVGGKSNRLPGRLAWTGLIWLPRSSASPLSVFFFTGLPTSQFSRCWKSGVNRSQRDIADSEKIKAELAQTETQRQETMLKADAQATKLIEEAHAAAARVKEQETQKAIAVAEQIIIKSREAAMQDHARMLTELKLEVGRLVVQTTAKITGKILTADDQRRLAEETSRRLAA